MNSFHQIEKYLDSRRHIGILLLRLFIGARLLYGVIDNIISWEKMQEFAGFLQHHGFPFPTVSAVVSVYVQCIGAIFILTGYRIRIASLVLVLNFIVALVFVHLRSGDSVEGMTPALAMLFGSMALVFTGRKG